MHFPLPLDWRMPGMRLERFENFDHSESLERFGGFEVSEGFEAKQEQFAWLGFCVLVAWKIKYK